MLDEAEKKSNFFFQKCFTWRMRNQLNWKKNQISDFTYFYFSNYGHFYDVITPIFNESCNFFDRWNLYIIFLVFEIWSLLYSKLVHFRLILITKSTISHKLKVGQKKLMDKKIRFSPSRIFYSNLTISEGGGGGGGLHILTWEIPQIFIFLDMIDFVLKIHRNF